MPYFTVYCTAKISKTYDVTANTPQEADEKAYDLFMGDEIMDDEYINDSFEVTQIDRKELKP
jgi:hypothetical protein